MQNKAALEYFVQMPVTKHMVNYLAATASQVIHCEPSPTAHPSYMPPTPPTTPPTSTPSSPLEPPMPSLEAFITSLVQQSHVGAQTLMPALVYLARLKERLPPVAKGMRCTVHRIFLAALILAAKNLNDSSPKNKYWARYTTVPGFPDFGFTNTEVNLMEKQMLFLLDWDLSITNEDLYDHLDPFLAPIRTWQQRQAEKAMQQMMMERQMKQQQELYYTQDYGHLTNIIQGRRTRVQRHGYDSPQSVSSYGEATYAQPRRRAYPSRSSSFRLPSRTPSLSPPTRTTSAASTYTSSVASSSPASSLSSYEQRHYQHQPIIVETCEDDYGRAPVVHIPAPCYTPGGHKTLQHPLPPTVEEEKPAKKLKTGASNLFSRILGSATPAYIPRTLPVIQATTLAAGY